MLSTPMVELRYGSIPSREMTVMLELVESVWMRPLVRPSAMGPSEESRLASVKCRTATRRTSSPSAVVPAPLPFDTSHPPVPAAATATTNPITTAGFFHHGLGGGASKGT
jgi:hypothetical protein